MAKLLSLYDKEFNLIKGLLLEHKQALERQLIYYSNLKAEKYATATQAIRDIESMINETIIILNKFNRGD